MCCKYPIESNTSFRENDFPTLKPMREFEPCQTLA